MAYDSTYSKIYFVGGVNKLYGIKVNEDGTFGDLEERKFNFCDMIFINDTNCLRWKNLCIRKIMVNLFSSDAKYKGYFGVASIGKDKTELNSCVTNNKLCTM